MTTYTPGPWWHDGYNVVCNSTEGTYSDHSNVKHYGGCLVCESIKTKANARLIAAAPDLLESLKEMVAAIALGKTPDTTHAVEIIKMVTA